MCLREPFIEDGPVQLKMEISSYSAGLEGLAKLATYKKKRWAFSENDFQQISTDWEPENPFKSDVVERRPSNLARLAFLHLNEQACRNTAENLGAAISRRL